jgi:hypothetical protein
MTLTSLPPLRVILSIFLIGASTVHAGPYAPPVGQPGSTAVAHTDPGIVAWATVVIDFNPGPVDATVPDGAKASFGSPSNALGPAWEDNVYGVVSLGDGGSITLGFANPITNGAGADFAVFENSFDDLFLELAHVEVSSNGTDFFRFPSFSLTQTATQVGGFGTLDTTNIHNLAGKYRGGFGTPFDLDDLVGVSPLLNVNAVTHVRVIDVVGSINPLYATYDSLGNIINDPWKTNFHTGGFDLDGIGVFHVIPEPSSLALVGLALAIGAGIGLRSRRRSQSNVK